MDGTILGQGTFSSFYLGVNPNTGVASVTAGNQVIVQIPSGADWMVVRNYTQAGTNGNSAAYINGTGSSFVGYEFYWQLGMAPGTGIVKYKTNAATTINENTLTVGGFTLYDPSGTNPNALPTVSAPIATTATSSATRPVVSTATTSGVQIGSIVRTYGTADGGIDGVDFVVGAISSGTSITLGTATNALANASGASGGAGFYQIINIDPLYYPRNRTIANITQAVNAQVSTTVPHNMTPGQAIRFNIPAASGMTQLNPTAQNKYAYGTVVTVVDAYNFTININTTGYTAFSWPTAAQQPSGLPQMIPLGENTAVALASPTAQVPLDQFGNPIFNANSGILADSTVNTGYLGMILGNGGAGVAPATKVTGPSGTVAFNSSNVITATDTVYWVAGKSTYGGQ